MLIIRRVQSSTEKQAMVSAKQQFNLKGGTRLPHVSEIAGSALTESPYSDVCRHGTDDLPVDTSR